MSDYSPSMLRDTIIFGGIALFMLAMGYRFGRFRRRPLPPTPLRVALCSSLMAERRNRISKECDQMAEVLRFYNSFNGRN